MAAERAQIVLRHAILCDDIRREDNQKPFIIGLYTDSVISGVKPAFVQLTFEANFNMPEHPSGVVEIELTGPQGSLKSEHDLSTVAIGQTQVHTRAALQLFYSDPAELVFKYRMKGGRWSSPIVWRLLFSENAIQAPQTAVDVLTSALNAVQGLHTQD